MLLELRQIKKDYASGAQSVKALRGIDIAFRESEFVSILGQSGCGKTTLLNIIGGLDNYTSGDLMINGTSTKEFKDRDWDTYRNHSVGFVFQSYNLIPHQNVLSNVELALTLTGVSKGERRRRAKEALEKVGLGDQLKKMPNQMSGGQMQRVAIARALVNNPDILLADEPTGALDSETSLQVMEILKEVAKDRLVIMVTHNPQLAEQYSTRIVRLLDGEIVSDSMPFDPSSQPLSQEAAETVKKPSMSFLTALGLSMNNLMTKKGRTLLTAFAGSIGIIGIALILSLSNGMQRYIDNMEADTLTSYPITIQQASVDMTSMMTAMMNVQKGTAHDDGLVHSSSIMTEMIGSMMQEVRTNDLATFKSVLEEEGNQIAELCSDIQYTYPTEVGIYTTSESGQVLRVNPVSILDEIGLGDVAGHMGMNNIPVCRELVDSQAMRDRDYELVSGAWPEAYNEVVLVVNENDEISDYTLYALGLKDPAALRDQLQSAMDSIAKTGQTEDDLDLDTQETTYTYEDLMGLDLRLVLPTDYYEKQPDGTYLDMREDTAYMAGLVGRGERLHVVGVVRTTDDKGSEYGALGYTSALTEYVIAQVEASDVMRAQKADPDTDVFTGLPFGDPKDAVEADAAMTAAQQQLVADATADLPAPYQSQLTEMEPQDQAQALISYGLLSQADYDAAGKGRSAEKTVSDSTYEANLDLLHAASLEEPSGINLYTASFEDKEALTQALDAYNDEKTDAGLEDQVIEYTDYVGVLMSSVTNIVNMVSYVLIAFVGISLVVSSIMIGVITLISVQERTKEIGILRAIGASKRDVSRVFNAETLIIGLSSGVLGIVITMLLNIPINLVINHLAGIDDVAQLPPLGALILVAISIVLTVVAGLIPSKAAAKKDPVEALRTE